MFTICWAAKGGSGTSVVAATCALTLDRPTLLVDIAGDLPLVLGLTHPDGPGLADWLESEAPPDRLERLELAVDGTTSLLPAGAVRSRPSPDERWRLLADRLAHDHRAVIVDAGTGRPPTALTERADRRWLVTRACYLALRAAAAQHIDATGIVLLNEPGRALKRSDLEAAVGAPVVAELLVDPAIARAVDSGLLGARLPSAFRRQLREAA